MAVLLKAHFTGNYSARLFLYVLLNIEICKQAFHVVMLDYALLHIETTWSFSIEALADSIGQMLVCKSPRSKLKHSRTEAPTEDRRVNIEVTTVHLFNAGSYLSTEFNDDEPSFPPSAYL